jgi:hypothetical protein
MSDLEHELNVHLARAHELGERVKAMNSAVEEQLRRTQLIVLALRGAAAHEEP